MYISIREISDIDYENACELINFEDADAEFLLAFMNKEENFNCVFDDDQLVGIVQLKIEKNAFIYIFIIPEFRNKGIGSNTLKLCEEKIFSNSVEKIITTYRTDDIQSKAFANKFGFTRKFSSAYMKYSGDRFDIPEQLIRNYCDKDYDSAHEMYAKAFHEMRVSVGDFPESVIEQPNENMRKYWAKTADERLVYMQDGMIVGYAHFDGDKIGSVSVRYQYQGQGIGRNFMKYICNKILDEGNKEVSLYCVVGNKARSLYDSLGFQEVYTIEYATKSIVLGDINFEIPFTL